MFQSLGQYDKAKEYLQKALVITTEIGDRNGEGTCYGNLGTVFQSLGRYDKAKEYLQKALAIKTAIGDRKGEETCYGNLGITKKRLLSQLKLATEEEKEKALSIPRDIGGRRFEFEVLREYAILYLFQNKIKDSLACLHLCIESMRS